MLPSFLPIFADLLLKSAAVLVCAAAAIAVLRQASAAARDLIWMTVFAALLLLPLTKIVTPRWAWHPPAPSETKVITIPLPQSASTPPAIVHEDPATPPASHTDRLRWPSWSEFAVTAWLLVCGALLARRAVGSLQLHILYSRSRPLMDTLTLQIAERISAEYGIARNVEFRSSTHCRVPMTWGIWRPVVMLPAESSSWPEHCLNAAIHHELGHVRRRDSLHRIVTQIACALYWPNPLVWFAARAAHTAQEQACDDLVLNAGAPAEDYARQLLDVAQSFRTTQPPFAAVSMAQPSTLQTRVRAIVDPTRNRRPANAKAAALACFAALLILAVSAIAQVRSGQEADHKSDPGNIDWQPFSEEKVAKGIQDGQPVFIDFTADWCINGKVFEKTVLDTPAVRSAFHDKNVLPLQADWTNQDEKIAQCLKKFGRVGVPLYVLYRPGESQPEVFDAITQSVLLGKLGVAAETDEQSQVLIEAKFIELDSEQALLELGTEGVGNVDGNGIGTMASTMILDQEQADALLTKLQKKSGFELLSAPKVITRSGQSVSIEIRRDIQMPSGWEPGEKSGTWKISSVEAQQVGVFFAATPRVNADHSITIDATPRICRLAGLLDLDTGKVEPGNAGGLAQAVPDSTPGSTVSSRKKALISQRKKTFTETCKPGTTLVIADVPKTPLKTGVSMYDSDTVALGGLMGEDAQRTEDKIPWISDLPIVGRLFRSQADQHVKTATKLDEGHLSGTKSLDPATKGIPEQLAVALDPAEFKKSLLQMNDRRVVVFIKVSTVDSAPAKSGEPKKKQTNRKLMTYPELLEEAAKKLQSGESVPQNHNPVAITADRASSDGNGVYSFDGHVEADVGTGNIVADHLQYILKNPAKP